LQGNIAKNKHTLLLNESISFSILNLILKITFNIKITFTEIKMMNKWLLYCAKMKILLIS